MNYNKAKGMAYFYDEDNVEIGKMKLREEQVKADAEFSLWKYLIEVGVLEGEEACVEELFEKLNKELGIDEFDKKNRNELSDTTKNAKPSASTSRSIIQKPKIPTKVASNESLNLYDILYTRDISKKTKTWHDGVMKYHARLKLAEFYDGGGVLVMKKTMEEVKEGMVVEGAGIVIEICALRSGTEVISHDDSKENVEGTQSQATKTSKSQNNATKTTETVMIAYSILYTTDKHKKAKKWLDGRLDYDPSSRLAKFIDEESGNCFYKKVMREGEVEVGAELQSGMYIIQVDHMIENGKMTSKVACETVQQQPQAKKIKSVVANDSVPLEGRSNEQLLSLLKSRIQK